MFFYFYKVANLNIKFYDHKLKGSKAIEEKPFYTKGHCDLDLWATGRIAKSIPTRNHLHQSTYRVLRPFAQWFKSNSARNIFIYWSIYDLDLLHIALNVTKSQQML